MTLKFDLVVHPFTHSSNTVGVVTIDKADINYILDNGKVVKRILNRDRVTGLRIWFDIVWKDGGQSNGRFTIDIMFTDAELKRYLELKSESRASNDDKVLRIYRVIRLNMSEHIKSVNPVFYPSDHKGKILSHYGTQSRYLKKEKRKFLALW